MPYYVMKSGLPMFDACRVYGLALLIDLLMQAADEIDDVIIQDVDTFYLVDAPPMDVLIQADTEHFFEPYFALTDGWCSAFLTTARSPIAENVKPASRRNVEKKIAEVQATLGNIRNVLENFSAPKFLDLSTSATNRQTIPSSLDLSAAKGIRRPKLDGYSEGEQLFTEPEHVSVAMFGAAHFIRWAWAGGDYVGLLVTPRLVTLSSHHAIKAVTDGHYLCSTSATTVVAHYAVHIAEALRQKKVDFSVFSDKYELLIAQSMSYSGNQWKAKAGAIFPLHYLLRLVESDLMVSDHLFDLWDHTFRWGSVKGNEQLSLTLASFLSQPSLTTFENYVRTHLRMNIADEKRRPFAPYQNEWMKEVLKYVE